MQRHMQMNTSSAFVVLGALLFNISSSYFAFALSGSPWSSSTWKFILSFSDQDSDARLALPVTVSIESDRIPNAQADVVVGERGAMMIEPVGSPTYINSKGEQTVDMGGGGWKIELAPGTKKGIASSLRLSLDLRSKLERNDVTVSPNILYLFAPCWREEDWDRGKMELIPIIKAAEEAQRVLDEQLSHESGDRRLDGTDAIDTLVAYKDMAQLVAERDERKRRQREAEKVYPKDADKMIMGSWPGTTEPLAIGKGTILIQKKRLFGDELCVIGRWDAVPVPKNAEADTTGSLLR